MRKKTADGDPRIFHGGNKPNHFVKFVRAKFVDVVKLDDLTVTPRNVNELVAVVLRQSVVVQYVYRERRGGYVTFSNIDSIVVPVNFE